MSRPCLDKTLAAMDTIREDGPCMSDFAQNGLICTLQRLNDTHLDAIESRLIERCREQPVALVLPCHAGELGRPALAHILRELNDARWINEIIVSMNGLDEAGFAEAESIFGTLRHPVRVLWNDRPGSAVSGGGKGANIAAAFRLLAEEKRVTLVVTQDCDVASFHRNDLARLCYPVADLGYHFAKAYYSRVTDRLYGRVSRLFLSPLLQALVGVAGHQPLVDFLLSFRYPLAGECAMTLGLASQLPVAPGWGLEIGQLCEVFRHLDPRDMCQVDCGAGYDHKHQPALTALADMAGAIAGELFRQVAVEGIGTGAGFHDAVLASYAQESTMALRRFANLARINNLPFDEEAERAIVEAFQQRLAEF